MRVVFIGPPGAGKGTQAKLLSKTLKIPHISTGDIIRAEIESGSSFGQSVEAMIAKGDLIPDSDSLKLVTDRTARPDCQEGYILDGFPRTVAQAESFTDVDVIVVIDVNDKEITKRLLARGRKDDVPEVIAHRIEVFKTLANGIIPVYSSAGKRIIRVDGTQSVDAVTKEIYNKLGDRNV